MLMIMTKDHRVVRGSQAIHSLLCEDEGIDPDDVISVGFMLEDREVWDKRQPYMYEMPLFPK